MLSDEDFYARLAYEAKILEEEEPSFKPIGGDLTMWEGFILGTGMYEGGVFKIQITVTRKFPYESPRVKWLTPIWHPNIYKKRVCVGAMGKDWTPTMSIAGLIEALRNLLNFPNPNSPLKVIQHIHELYGRDMYHLRLQLLHCYYNILSLNP